MLLVLITVSMKFSSRGWGSRNISNQVHAGVRRHFTEHISTFDYLFSMTEKAQQSEL